MSLKRAIMTGMERSTHAPIWISTPQGLSDLAAELMRHRLIGVDTESNSLFAYREQVCLLQFSTTEHDYLVDTLALDDLSPLRRVFAHRSIEKIFHAAEYDIICLKRDYGFTFNNLFDTMQAARILGWEALGLGAILENLYGVQVDKRFQRANWARRPLSDEQVYYASQDTHYLIRLREHMRNELLRSRRMTLAQEDFKRLTKVEGSNGEKNGSCWKAVGKNELTPRQMAVFKALWLLRETLAEKMDRPPFKVLTNQALVDLAKASPASLAELETIPGVGHNNVRRIGNDLLKAVQHGLTAEPPVRSPSRRPDDAYMNRLERLKQWRKATARAMGVESDVVLPRDLMEHAASDHPHTLEELQHIMQDTPWRFRHFGSQLVQVINT